MSSIITVGLNPTLQKTMVFSSLTSDTVNRCTECRFDVAGKALNVSRVLTQLGKKNIHLTQLGGNLRPVFLELCELDKLNVKWAESYSNIRICCTLIDKEKNQVTELVEEGDSAGQGTEERLLEAFNSLLPNASIFIIAGSKTAGFSANIIPEMVSLAKNAGLFVMLDIRGTDLLNSLPFKPDIIKPNLDEFTATFSDTDVIKTNRDKEGIAVICLDLWKKYGCNIILTRGAESIWYAEAGEFKELTVDKVLALNPIGSGDAFTAGFASAYADGVSFAEALAEGSRCARLNALNLRSGSIL